MTYYISIFSEHDYSVFIYSINLVIAFTIIFLERKNPSATLAWMLVLFLFPVGGLIFYLILSQNISRQKIYRLSDSEKKMIGSSLRQQMTEITEDRFPFENETAAKWKHMVKLNLVYGLSYLTQDNEIELLCDGKTMYHRLLRDIKNAKESIDVEYYIIKDDMVGRKFLRVLTQKAEEGVEVRLLMDALGCRFINDYKLKDFLAAGGKAAYFFKPKLKCLNFKLNYRNHRKIVVIDKAIGYMGGFNIANEYLGFKKKFGYWRDTHIRIRGGSVIDLAGIFVMDWRFASKEKVELTKSLFMQGDAVGGKSPVQIVSCGPNSVREEIKRSMMKMITYAEERVYLQTPYFIPDSSMLESLKMAAQSGVDVRIMIPCMPDHIFVYWATIAYCGELIKSGARVFIYDNGFLHAKTMVVDGEVATVGSANFDRRSFKLNFEANAFVYDRPFAAKMEAQFLEDMQQSHELTLEDYSKRTLIIKFKEAISRLLSDIL